MPDPFILNILKHPLSAPALAIIHILLLLYIFYKIKSEIFKNCISSIKNFSRKNYYLISLVSLGIIFLFSTFLLFYKITAVPPAGFVDDDALIVITANVLKNTGEDSNGVEVPYYPYLNIKYHNEIVGGGGPVGIPVYYQSFLQYLTDAGHYSLRLECTLLMFLTSLVVLCSLYLINQNVFIAVFGGMLFNLLPWTRILARVTPQTTAYCFASACFLLSILFLVKNKNKVSILFYLISLTVLFLSYTPGILLGGLSAIIIPIIFLKDSFENKSFAIKILIFGLLFLGVTYNGFKDEQSYKWNIARAQGAQGLEGISGFNTERLIKTFVDKGKLYSGNFLGYLMPQFLFFNGDPNLRHNTDFDGQLFICLFIAFYVGLFYVIFSLKNNLLLKLLLFYLLLANIPASVCLEGGIEEMTKLPLHALRGSSILPPIVIITCIGFYKIFQFRKTLFFVYIIAFLINMQTFYKYYFYEYPRKLGNSSIADYALNPATNKALNILEKDPKKKLFYSCNLSNVIYYNIKKIGVDSILHGDGLLANVYHYYNRGSIEPKAGDIFVVQEPFDYAQLNRKYKFIERYKNIYLPNETYGTSLFEIEG